MILASASPRRKELLSFVTSHFTISPADIDETVNVDEAPKEYVSRMAREKAKEIVKLYPNETVIGCDTTVVLDNEIMGKPMDEKDAYNMLEKLSGTTHKVMTAVCVITPEETYEHVEVVDVLFYDLDEEDITGYIKTGEPMDKAGAYGIQGKASVFVKEIKGDYFSIVGLPVGYLNQLFKQLGR
ncbi:Maf family protein [Vagococcus bubulae]|uniref:Maf family protein n=1 Tax=Vagococcus bubulae TaxID=1977868 RepID=UPI000F7F3E9F|nr:Maf family protein [Vagococcus bubulae]